MKRFRLLPWLALGTLICSISGFNVMAAIGDSEPAYQAMPPNEAKIMSYLLKKYNLKVDDSDKAALTVWSGTRTKSSATATTITSDAAKQLMQSYLQQKLNTKPDDRPNHRGKEENQAPVQQRHGHSVKQKAANATTVSPEKIDNILVLLVEFSDVTHNQIPKPDATNNMDYWVSDFNASHYQTMLFSRTPNALSMSNYYLEQSLGKYTVDGKISNWVKVTLPESGYGADAANGHDNANGPVWRVVRDAVNAVGNAVDWVKYDQEDPYDLDSDGVYAEADGYVDHLMLVHAGAGQEGGGGAQGDDAIWSHSSWANGGFNGPGLGGVQTAASNVWVGPYTIMPEDGAIGVFCHEFAHDLGLPDEYDTIYSGEASPTYWSLMASGSWLGKPLGTQPSAISIWGRIQLGWIKPEVVDYQSQARFLWLDRKGQKRNVPAVKINLPAKDVLVSTNTPYRGTYEWFSGSGDDLNNKLTRTVDLTSVTQAKLVFWTWYSIEAGYDFGFVEVSKDGGKVWTSLPGNLTTLVENSYVLTGASDGWVQASYDLSAYAGSNIKLRFRYYTDGGLSKSGWAIDDLAIETIGYSDTCENGSGDWIASGWKLYKGQETVSRAQYYLLEQRNFEGFDACLQDCYNYYGVADVVQYFSYNPGVLVWFADEEYTDNWVGNHPGHGFLLVVDSHPVSDKVADKVLKTRIQIRDAAFGLKQTYPATISLATSSGTVTGKLKSQWPNPWFSDNQSYWVAADPDNSTLVPNYGVNFRVLGTNNDNSKSLVYIYFSK